MTEHSKIPVPEDKSAPATKRGSLIERAVGTFHLGDFSPPPVPDKLAPPRRKPAARPAPAPTVAALPASEPAAAEAPRVPAGAAVPATEVPRDTAPATPALTNPAPVADPVVKPVTFTGARHPIDRDRLARLGLIVPEGKVTALLEEFRIVKRQLLAQAADLRRQGGGPAAQRILVSSPHPGEGKTYCSINLALAFAAEMQSDVLLVDADFAKPSIPEMLGLPAGPGLMDALTDDRADVADLVMGTDIPGLFVLPAGTTTNSDSEYLTSARTSQVLDRLTEGAPQRLVIFDSPPALAASPAAELAKHVAQAVVIVRADKTGRGALEDAVSLLSACPNIQLLLNAVLFSPSGRSFGTYYGYGGSKT